MDMERGLFLPAGIRTGYLGTLVGEYRHLSTCTAGAAQTTQETCIRSIDSCVRGEASIGLLYRTLPLSTCMAGRKTEERATGFNNQGPRL